MEWRQIPGYSAYEVSEIGDVRRIVDGRTRKAGPIKGDVNGGYRRVKLTDDAGIKRSLRVHRLMCLAFYGEPPTPRHWAAHWDDVKLNNSLANLYWATPLQNHDDRRRNGRSFVGSRNGRARITSATVSAMRAAYTGAHGEQSAIARRFGVSPSQAREILLGESWAA